MSFTCPYCGGLGVLKVVKGKQVAECCGQEFDAASSKNLNKQEPAGNVANPNIAR